MWVKTTKKTQSHKQCLQEELVQIDLLLDKGEGSSTLISKRMETLKSIQDFVKLDAMELAQKAKIKWAIEGDENLKYYHGVLNKKRNQLAIPCIWWKDTREEIKKSAFGIIWVDKSPGPDGFTFGFYRQYWTFLEDDVVEAVFYFFNHGQFPKGSNSSFITLIPKTQEA
ncbi:hypothetical protein Tco_1473779 [Tanacetum coccineum]